MKRSVGPERRRRWIYALVVGGIPYAATAMPMDGTAQEALLEVSINGEKQAAWTLITLAADGGVWVRRTDLQSWGIRIAAPDAVVELNALPGVHADIDHAASLLAVEVQPALLDHHDFRAVAVSPHATSSPLGGFINYDVGATREQASSEFRAATEIGATRDNWIARSSWFDVTGGGQSSNLRVDTNVTADFPATRSSLQGGDTFARLGTSAEAVRVGGVSWGTDFSVTPTFITMPLPTVSTVATSASTVDVFVNGSKTQQLNVPGGPFTISGIPVTTGTGELTVVTHDLLGHTQTFSQSYYVAPQMLQSGLSAWDIEAGSKRLQYGIQSNDYAGWLAAAGDRYGLSDRVTASWRVEADETGAGLSMQGLFLTSGNTLLTFASTCAATSEPGCLVDTAFEHDLATVGYGSDFQYATTRYTPVAAAERAPTPRWRLFSHVQAAGGYGTSFMIGGIWEENPDGTHSSSLNVTAGKSWQGGHLDLIVSRTGGSLTSSYIALVYTHSLDQYRSVSAMGYSTNGQSGASATLQRNLPAGDGFGYQLRAGYDSSTEAAAGVQWNGDSVAASGLAQREGDRSSLSAELSGAALWFGGDVFLSRHLDRSFAVVHADSLSDLPVFLNGQEAARTDARGNAVLPGLRPFETNHIDLDVVSLPLAVDVPQTSFQVVPYRRGGAWVSIPVRLGANVRLNREDGTAVPSGAHVHGSGAIAPVGGDGRAYIEGLAGDNALRVEWGVTACVAHLRLPAPPPTGESDEVALSCVAIH